MTSLELPGPSKILACSSSQGPFKKTKFISTQSTLPTGAVMFHWHVALEGSSEEPFSRRVLFSVAVRCTNDCSLPVQAVDKKNENVLLCFL